MEDTAVAAFYALQSVWNKAETAIQALRGLQQPKGADTKQQLFEDDDGVFLTFSTKKIVTPPLKPMPINLPTPLMSSDASVCLFMYDRKEKTALISELKDRLTKVIPFNKLRKRYREYPAKRELRETYDLFVVQQSAVKDINHHVASVFSKSHKMPVPVSTENKTADEIVAKINNLKQCAFFYHPKGAAGTIQVARKNMTDEEIMANLIAVVDGIITRSQFKLHDISSFGIKTQSSPNLPFYQSDAPAYELPTPPPSKKNKKRKAKSAAPSGPPQKKQKTAAVKKEDDKAGTSTSPALAPAPAPVTAPAPKKQKTAAVKKEEEDKIAPAPPQKKQKIAVVVKKEEAPKKKQVSKEKGKKLASK